MNFQSPSISHASELEELSSWRMYRRGLKELIAMEAPKSSIVSYRFKAARECFLAFAELMKEGNLKVADFHEVIGSAFEDLVNRRYRRLIISCPPRSGKSMLSCLFIAWLLGRDQQTQHIMASYGQQLSTKFHKEVVTYLKNPFFSRVFPEWKGFRPDSRYEMLGGGYILPTSVGGALTGWTGGTTNIESPGVGATLIDDPLKSSESSAAIDALHTWWAEECSTRRTNNWVQVCVATRFHQQDLHGLLMETDGLYDPNDNPMGWRWINIYGIIETAEQRGNDVLGRDLGETHWPDNNAFTPDMLLSQKKAMGSNAFSALYQGNPVSEEGQIIQDSWIYRVDAGACPEFDLTWLAVDCAFSEKEMADETAICVASISHRHPGKVYIRDIITGRLGFPDLIAKVKHLYAFYDAKVLCIEKAASGQSLIQMLKKEAKIPIEEMKPLKSKTIRLQAVAPLMEFARVKFVEGDWIDPFLKELMAFPFTKHDDRTDAFTWALTYYAMKLDTVDKGLQDSIIQNKRFFGDLTRPGFGNKDAFPNLTSKRLRLFPADHSYNDPDGFESADGSSDTRSSFVRGVRAGKRGIGWDTDI
jgi:predicted phage terminase large subunit-like protein